MLAFIAVLGLKSLLQLCNLFGNGGQLKLNTSTLKEKIMQSVGSTHSVTLINECKRSSKENETLFFLKPEFFLLEDFDKTDSLLTLIFEKINEFNIDISGVLALKGGFLKEARIIERHYGFINRMSVEGSKLLTNEDYEKICKALSFDSLDGFIIKGGHELINSEDGFDEARVTELWYSKDSFRMGEGFYIQHHNIKGKNVIIINGFNPHQIKHYTDRDSKIVLFLLQTDTDWTALRSRFVGDTFPESAAEGSIRNILYRNAEKYGIKSISVADNFVHTSSGPFDALFEICNFASNIKGVNFSRYNTNIYYLMKEKFGLTETDFKNSIDNPTAVINGEKTDLFSFTKNKNTLEAITEYKNYFMGKIAG